RAPFLALRTPAQPLGRFVPAAPAAVGGPLLHPARLSATTDKTGDLALDVRRSRHRQLDGDRTGVLEDERDLDDLTGPERLLQGGQLDGGLADLLGRAGRRRAGRRRLGRVRRGVARRVRAR